MVKITNIKRIRDTIYVSVDSPNDIPFAFKLSEIKDKQDLIDKLKLLIPHEEERRKYSKRLDNKFNELYTPAVKKIEEPKKSILKRAWDWIT